MLALRRHCLSKLTRPNLSPITSLPSLLVHRSFSNNDDNDNSKPDKSDTDFFLQSEETSPTPPSYVRDSLTGKWTNQTQAELTKKDARLLTLDDDAKDDELMNRLEQRWEEALQQVTDDEKDDDGFGTLHSEHERIARRIQEEELALGPIGRGPNGDGALTRREFQAMKGYASKKYGINPKDLERDLQDDPSLLPHGSIASGTSQDRSNITDPDLDLAYLNPKLKNMAYAPEGTENEHSDPFADLLPSDFNPARKVNRRHAQPLPTKALHHNNLVLLRRYSTPGGKIMNRVQSRLGAKDQRKIAKLIKRARHLGLIPHMGQWKFEDHGYLNDPGLDEKKEWEVELEERGLWPLADEKEIFKRYYGMEEILDRVAGERGSKKREQLEELLNVDWMERMEKSSGGGEKNQS
jgi:small subunit ribosomal protein S18